MCPHWGQQTITLLPFIFCCTMRRSSVTSCERPGAGGSVAWGSTGCPTAASPCEYTGGGAKLLACSATPAVAHRRFRALACTLASDAAATQECVLSMIFPKRTYFMVSGAQSTLRVLCHRNAAQWVQSSPNKSCQRYCTNRGSASQGLDTRQQDVLRLPGRSCCPALDAILVQQNLAAMGCGSPLPRHECVWSTDSSPARH